MQTKKLSKNRSIALAVAAAGLLAAGASVSVQAGSTTIEMAHCYGVNACKGHNDCKTADNACGGHGSCKGKGFVAMPTKACMDIGGELKDDWRGKAKLSN